MIVMARMADYLSAYAKRQHTGKVYPRLFAERMPLHRMIDHIALMAFSAS
jgi:hypothetical protein